MRRLLCWVKYSELLYLSCSPVTFVRVLKWPSFLLLFQCFSLGMSNIRTGNCTFFFFSNQTKHKLYINKQISSFIFPVGCQTCQGPLLLNCQHSTLHSPNWAYMSPSFLSLPHTHTQHYTGIHKLSQTVYVTEVTVVVWVNECLPMQRVSIGNKAAREIKFSRKVETRTVVQVFLIRWRDNPAGALCWQKDISFIHGNREEAKIARELNYVHVLWCTLMLGRVVAHMQTLFLASSAGCFISFFGDYQAKCQIKC